jgi:hypothetical protein
MSNAAQELEQALRDMQRVGGGVVTMTMYSQDSIAMALLSGESIELFDMLAIENLLEQFAAGTRCTCLLCEAELSMDCMPASIMVVRPETDALTAVPETQPLCAVIANGICSECSTRDNVRASAMEYYRQHVYPELRLLDVHSGEGHS